MAQVFRERERPSRAMGAPTGSMTVGRSNGTRLSSRAGRAADAALLAGHALGDPSAATAFVRRFQGSVLGLALSVTREHTLAEDVAQEAFIRAWKAAATYDAGRGSVSTWVLRITRNDAIDAVRAAVRPRSRRSCSKRSSRSRSRPATPRTRPCTASTRCAR